MPAEKEPAKAPAPAAPAASIVAKPKSIQAAAANATSKPIPEAPTQSEEEKKVALIVELEKRKARAARWGLPTADVEAKLQRAIKFGIDANQDPTLDKLEGGLKGGKKREVKGEKKEEDAGSKVTADKKHPAPKPIETEEEKAARIARQEADEAAKKRRAERFGIPTIEKSAATANAVQSPAIADPAEEERKRKRMEKFGSAPSAEVSCLQKREKRKNDRVLNENFQPADKKIKA